MTTWFGTAMPGAVAGSRVETAAIKLPAGIASGWTQLRSAWMRRLARRRLRQSIAHLDDRLLADVGLGPQDLGLGERLARRFAAPGNVWSAGKSDA